MRSGFPSSPRPRGGHASGPGPLPSRPASGRRASPRSKASRKARRATALTLVELAIVAGIIGILALIAVPSMVDASIRARVAVSRNNQRVLAGGLEAYHVDQNRYPVSAPLPPNDPFGILANYQMSGLTTPIGYIAEENFRDPFGVIRAQDGSAGRDRPVPALPNPKQSQLYYHYASFAARTNNAKAKSEGVGVVSLGPDSEDTFGAFTPFADALPPFAGLYGVHARQDTIYDPTNGLVSRGDIGRYVSVSGVELAP